MLGRAEVDFTGRKRRALFLAWIAAGLVACIMHDTIAAETQRSTLSAAAAGEPSFARNALQRIEYAMLTGGRTLVRLQFTHDLQERPAVLATYHPAATVALDFANAANHSGQETIEVGQRDLRSIQVTQAANRLRLILRLARPAPHTIAINGRELLVTLHRPAPPGDR